MTQLHTARRDAEQAARSLSGTSPMNAITAYLEQLADDVARSAMNAPRSIELRRKQGEYRALKTVVALLLAEQVETKTTHLRGV